MARAKTPLLSALSLRVALFVAVVFASASTALASGPRWFSGPPYFYNWYLMVGWYTHQPSYYTDPGDLSASVNHDAADALVARAAAVWNIPTASLVLAQGGLLNEHVSSANLTATPTGVTFPTDVQPSNYQAKQIAILYDTDGSVTDTLLGAGASDPSGCYVGGVTESVDSIGPDGHIYHAMLILNGRCTGPEPEKQLQLQYQLERAFGRILGLGWSQTNDNVFTGSPQPTATQALNWPIMHPIDINCGPYSYQCLPQPFTLRPDDISALEELYFINPGQAGPGKQPSWSNGGGVYGSITFPNGQGMEGVNVVVHRRAPFWDTPEDWEIASAISGLGFRGKSTTSIAPQDNSIAGSQGAPGSDWEGKWGIQTIPVPPSQAWTDLVVSTQPINPLYIGPYAIGPTTGTTMSPSGSPQVQVSQYLANGRNNSLYFTVPDAAPICSSQTDGTESAPSPVPQGGWWNGTFCGYLHQAWSSLTVAANRTLTIEVTALDETGAVSMTKSMPTIGVWKVTDATGTLPTVASMPEAFNTATVGLTALQLQSSSAPTTYRIDLADQRGAGRPDFAYQARILYADSVAPSNLPAAGGTITVTGLGFRQGNVVLINNTPVTVTSASANSLVVTAPSLHTLGLSRQTVASITVQDSSTGGTTTMSAALSYAAPVEALQLVSAPSGTAPVGTPASTAFSVQAIAPDGFTPIVGEVVNLTATGATLSACGTASCTVATNSSGIASVTVTPTAQGAVRLSAIGRSGTVTASFTATGGPDVLHLISAPSGVATVGTVAAIPVRAQLLAFDGVTPRVGAPVTLSVASGAAKLSGCSTFPCVLATDAQGTVSTTVLPTSAGAITVRAAAVASTVTASFTAAPETILLTSAPSATQIVGTLATGTFQIKVLAGDGITPVQGEAIVLSAIGGAVSFSACGGAVCTLTTDARELAQSTVTPLAGGTITLNAIGNAGVVTSTFTAVTRLRTVAVLRPIEYVAAGAVVSWTPQVSLADNSAPVAGIPVVWTGSTGLTPAGTSTPATAAGTAVTNFSIGPIASGQQVQGTACAWGTVCSTVAAVGVAPSDWRVAVVSGAAQSISFAATPAAITLRVTDLSGNPVAGVPVSVGQTITTWEAPCSGVGRCAVASTLATAQSSATSDADGLITIQPTTIPGAPTISQVAVSAGASGFTTLSIERHP